MTDLKGKTEKDLIVLLNQKRVALKAFRFNVAGSKTRNVKEGRGIKKEVAQILTEMHSRKQK